MARQKHKPQRTCAACRSVKDKRDLLRIVRTTDGQVLPDFTGKVNGRGVYLCKSPGCWEKGLTKERLSHALRMIVAEDNIEVLRRALQAEITDS